MKTIKELLHPFITTAFGTGRPKAFSTVAASPLKDLYAELNGGYFWGRALLIRPVDRLGVPPLDLESWNSSALWKSLYDQKCSDCTFFAEDAFGVQFGVRDAQFVQFDPETAEIIVLADSLKNWCTQILTESENLTGFPVLTAWEKRHGVIPAGNRLVPKQLFMFGGEFHSANMVSKPDVEGMRIRGQLWSCTKNLPEGAEIIFNATDEHIN